MESGCGGSFGWNSSSSQSYILAYFSKSYFWKYSPALSHEDESDTEKWTALAGTWLVTFMARALAKGSHTQISDSTVTNGRASQISCNNRTRLKLLWRVYMLITMREWLRSWLPAVARVGLYKPSRSISTKHDTCGNAIQSFYRRLRWLFDSNGSAFKPLPPIANDVDEINLLS